MPASVTEMVDNVQRIKTWERLELLQFVDVLRIFRADEKAQIDETAFGCRDVLLSSTFGKISLASGSLPQFGDSQPPGTYR